MSARISIIFAWGALVLTTAAALGMVLVSVAAGSYDLALITDPINGWLTGFVGALIVSKRHQNPVGWVALLISLSLTIGAFTELYSILALPHGIDATPGAMAALWVSQWVWVGTFAGLCLLLHLFPTGRPLDRFWRVVMQLTVAAQTGLLILFAVNSPLSIENADQTLLEVANPVGLVMVQDETVFLVLFLGVLLAPTILALVAMILRYVRAVGVERQQMKWLLYAASLFVVTLLVPFVVEHPLLDILVEVTALAMPIAVGLALLRYRLYDIDLIIRRTLTYGLVTALLLGVFAISIIVLQQLFASVTGTGQNELVTVLSTLAIAALFVPVRNRIQEWIDRRFNRNKYDAQRVLADFAQTVRDETDLEKLTARLMQVVDETMQPKSLSLWLRNVGKGRGRE